MEIDDHALMRAFSDLLDSVMRGHVENNVLPVDLRDDGGRDNAQSNRGRGKMANIDRRADRSFPWFQVVGNGTQRCILHRQNHDRRREYKRKRRVLDLARQMLRLHVKREASCYSERYGGHGLRRMFVCIRRNPQHCTKWRIGEDDAGYRYVIAEPFFQGRSQVRVISDLEAGARSGQTAGTVETVWLCLAYRT